MHVGSFVSTFHVSAEVAPYPLAAVPVRSPDEL
jgi:hypothetical protein